MTDIVKPLKQRHVETLVRLLRDQGISLAEPYATIADAEGKFWHVDAIPIHGEIARAATQAEMLNGASPDELEPWQIADLAARIIRIVRESLSVPKASSSQPQSTPTDAEPARTS